MMDKIGKTKKVLFEQEENEGFLYGFTENYVKVKTPFAAELVNQIVDIQITEIDRDGLAKCLILANFAEI
jgi:threonylcarbamoyladenosine tRNA methylthiotransferase MtaB